MKLPFTDILRDKTEEKKSDPKIREMVLTTCPQCGNL